MQRKTVILAAAITCATAGLAAWVWYGSQSGVQYKTAPVEHGDINVTISATGNPNAVVTVQVGSQVSGSIMALYADFNTKVTKGQLIARIEKAQAEGTTKSALIADFKQWADTLQPAGKGNRNSQAAINQAAARSVIVGTAARLDTLSPAETLAVLRAWERALAR